MADYLSSFFAPFAEEYKPTPAPKVTAPAQRAPTWDFSKLMAGLTPPTGYQAPPVTMPYQGYQWGGGMPSIGGLFGEGDFQYPGAAPTAPPTTTAAVTTGAPVPSVFAPPGPRAGEGAFRISPEERAILTGRGGQAPGAALFGAGIGQERIQEMMRAGAIGQAPGLFGAPTPPTAPPTAPPITPGAPPTEERGITIGDLTAEPGEDFSDYLARIKEAMPALEPSQAWDVQQYVKDVETEMDLAMESVRTKYEGPGGLFDETRRQQSNLKGSMLAGLIKAGVPKASSTYQSALQAQERREAEAISRQEQSLAAEMQSIRTGKMNVISQTLAQEQARQDTLAQQGISNLLSFSTMFSQIARDQLAQQVAAAKVTQDLSDAEAEAAQDWIDNMLDNPPNMDDPGVREKVMAKAARYGLDPETFESQLRRIFQLDTLRTAKGGAGAAVGMFDPSGQPTSKYWTLSDDEKNTALGMQVAQWMSSAPEGTDFTMDDRRDIHSWVTDMGGNPKSAQIKNVLKQYAPLQYFNWFTGTVGKG